MNSVPKNLVKTETKFYKDYIKWYIFIKNNNLYVLYCIVIIELAGKLLHAQLEKQNIILSTLKHDAFQHFYF